MAILIESSIVTTRQFILSSRQSHHITPLHQEPNDKSNTKLSASVPAPDQTLSYQNNGRELNERLTSYTTRNVSIDLAKCDSHEGDDGFSYWFWYDL